MESLEFGIWSLELKAVCAVVCAVSTCTKHEGGGRYGEHWALGAEQLAGRRDGEHVEEIGGGGKGIGA